LRIYYQLSRVVLLWRKPPFCRTPVSCHLSPGFHPPSLWTNRASTFRPQTSTCWGRISGLGSPRNANQGGWNYRRPARDRTEASSTINSVSNVIFCAKHIGAIDCLLLVFFLLRLRLDAQHRPGAGGQALAPKLCW